ncbi:hypothetical protein AB0C76_33025 [Kitasatospora sp. NPDC048722]|uniref:hypothetical protein n=1 Tax=Kitasatospora sp. NPDC048722 TaxID=3155639 RepID=UPI0033DD953D
MATTLTHRQLKREVRRLAQRARRQSDGCVKLADVLGTEARETERIAEQIAALKVDQATVAETREAARTMSILGGHARVFGAAAAETGRWAFATERQAKETHDGIQEGVDRSPVQMADRTWYTQE